MLSSTPSSRLVPDTWRYPLHGNKQSCYMKPPPPHTQKSRPPLEMAPLQTHKGKTTHQLSTSSKFASPEHRTEETRTNQYSGPGQCLGKKGSNENPLMSTLRLRAYLNPWSIVYIQQRPEGWWPSPSTSFWGELTKGLWCREGTSKSLGPKTRVRKSWLEVS